MHEQMIVGEAIAGRSATVRRDLLRLSGDVAVQTLDLAELLYEVQTNGYAQSWGFESLADYAQRELGLKPRKSQYLSKIISVMQAVGLKRAQFENAGITKLRDITVLDPEGSFFDKETRVSEPLDAHIVRLVVDASDMTVEQVREEVLRLQGRLGPDRPTTKSYTVPCSAYDLVIKPAFELIRMRLGSQRRDAEGKALEYSDGAVLECMCAEVLSDVHNQPEDELPMEEK